MTTLSVVVPSVNGWKDLKYCLAALGQQDDGVTLDVIVVDRCGESVRKDIRDAFPWARILEVEASATIPGMRAVAFDAAIGGSVAVIEDHVIVPTDWARRLLNAQDEGEDVVGGAVENVATERLVDWAAFLCEYSQLLPPLPSGRVAGLPGNNTVYRRSLLERYHGVIAAGRWEDHLHAAMRRDGIALISRPEILVGHKRHYTVGEYARERYWYSRAYAGLVSQDASPIHRLLSGARCLLLPPVLYWRITSTVWRKGTHRRELISSLPLLVLFVGVWAAGEVIGHWFGGANALQKVR